MELMLLRMFQKQVYLQCKFVLLSANEVNTSLVEHDITRTFYGIQNLLNATADISKALWGQCGTKTEERRPLRESINVSDDSPLRRILVRNDFEHFDERLDRWWEQSTCHIFVDLNLESQRASIRASEIDTFRNFNPKTSDVYFWGTDFNLNDLVAEINCILPKLAIEANKPHWET